MMRELNTVNNPPRPFLKKNVSFIQLLTDGNNEIRPNMSGTRRFISHGNILEGPVKSNGENAKKKRRKEAPILSAVEKRERRRKVQEHTDRTRRTFMNKRLEVLRQREKGESRSARSARVNELFSSSLLR